MKESNSLNLILILIVGLLIGAIIGFIAGYSFSASNTTGGMMNNPSMMRQMMRGMMGGKTQKSNFSSNGKRIYFTATGNSGKPITATMGKMKMTSSMMACVDCHGENGKGRTVRMPMGSFKTPNITYKELTEEEKFTDEDIKKAITKGIEPDGEHLKFPMPQWSMSKEDLKDLMGYLKTL